MTPPQQPPNPHPAYQHWAQYERPLAPRQGRVATWDVICSAVLWAILFIAAAVAAWLSLFFAFASDACPTDGCQPVPFHIDAFIYPVTWGGIGIALLLATAGSLVSVWRRWYMFFWPLIGIGTVMTSFLAGFAMTAYSARHWH